MEFEYQHNIGILVVDIYSYTKLIGWELVVFPVAVVIAVTGASYISAFTKVCVGGGAHTEGGGADSYCQFD